MAYHPRFTITPQLLSILEDIAVTRAKIQAATIQVSWMPTLQKEARAHNTHSSTAIEGNPLTLDQVERLAEGKHVVDATERARREVLNYFTGLRFIQRHQRTRTITHAHIVKLHALIAAGVMDQGTAGQYRTIAVRIGAHRPPPAAQVAELMGELLQWWSRDSAQWSPVITSAIIHYRFEDIHPFADGNGRVGRTLALWELYRRGFDTHHIFAVDDIYWEKRQRYYAALDAVPREHGDLTGWLMYAAEALQLTLDRVWVRVQRFSVTQGARKVVLRPKQEQLLQLLQERESLTPRELWKALGVSKQGAMNVIKPLVKSRLVRRVGTRKSGRYLLA